MDKNRKTDKRLDGWRTDSMYTFGEAAHLAHVSASTVRNWVLGYRDIQPLFTSTNGQDPMVSFIQLIEIVVAARFRKADHVSYQRVRSAYENAKNLYQLSYPFAHLTLEAIGRHIVQWLNTDEPDVSLQTLDDPQQWTLPGLVAEAMAQLDYEEDLAARWYPVGKDVPIVVDPRMSAGTPTIKGRGVTIQVIRKRFKAGQNMEFIAKDFELEQSVIEEAVRYAEQVAA